MKTRMIFSAMVVSFVAFLVFIGCKGVTSPTTPKDDPVSEIKSIVIHKNGMQVVKATQTQAIGTIVIPTGENDDIYEPEFYDSNGKIVSLEPGECDLCCNIDNRLCAYLELVNERESYDFYLRGARKGETKLELAISEFKSAPIKLKVQ
jgi:hypothetical protein